MAFYEFGSDGCQALAHLLGRGRCVFKKGFVYKGKSFHVDRRRSELAASAYGAFHRDPENPERFVEEPGFDAWRTSSNRLDDFKNILLPERVRVEDDVYKIALPAGIAAENLDGWVKTRLQPRELGVWAQSSEGRAVCAKQGFHPARLVRFTRGPKTGEMVRAVELYVFNPRRDRALFASMLAEALAYRGPHAA